MKWKYCENCYIDGHCENQDRGHECNVYAKRITDKAERLQKQLDIAVKALEDYAESDNWELENEKYGFFKFRINDINDIEEDKEVLVNL